MDYSSDELHFQSQCGFSISGIFIIIYVIYCCVSSISILLSRAIITFCVKFLHVSRVLTIFTSIPKLVDFTYFVFLFLQHFFKKNKPLYFLTIF